MTLREEILKNSGIISETASAAPNNKAAFQTELVATVDLGKFYKNVIKDEGDLEEDYLKDPKRFILDILNDKTDREDIFTREYDGIVIRMKKFNAPSENKINTVNSSASSGKMFFKAPFTATVNLGKFYKNVVEEGGWEQKYSNNPKEFVLQFLNKMEAEDVLNSREDGITARIGNFS